MMVAQHQQPWLQQWPHPQSGARGSQVDLQEELGAAQMAPPVSTPATEAAQFATLGVHANVMESPSHPVTTLRTLGDTAADGGGAAIHSEWGQLISAGAPLSSTREAVPFVASPSTDDFDDSGLHRPLLRLASTNRGEAVRPSSTDGPHRPWPFTSHSHSVDAFSAPSQDNHASFIAPQRGYSLSDAVPPTGPTMIPSANHEGTGRPELPMTSSLPAHPASWLATAAVHNLPLPTGGLVGSSDTPYAASMDSSQHHVDHQHQHMSAAAGYPASQTTPWDSREPHNNSNNDTPWAPFSSVANSLPSSSMPSHLAEASFEHGRSHDYDLTTEEGNESGEMEEDVSGTWASGSAVQAIHKAPRRQGVTCDQCRVKHLRCDLAEKIAEAYKARSAGAGSPPPSICSRCSERGLVCNKTSAPPSRRYPRPSRTGKRIEQARSMHGSVTTAARQAGRPSGADAELGGSLFAGIDDQLSGSVFTASLSLRLLACYFNTAHVQTPVIDFTSFSTRFNAAQGNPRVMSIMLNGGDEATGIPSMPVNLPGLVMKTWPHTSESTISTPGTCETLIAAMHAWAAHYTDEPIAFGGMAQARALGISQPATYGQGPTDSADAEPSDSYGPDSDYSHLPPSKRPKRKQGVACDTCRLRRVRCDLMERKDGGPCSRCQDKRIVCTDQYIQLKRRKNQAKLAKEKERQRQEERPTSGQSSSSSSVGPESSWNQLGLNPDPLTWGDAGSAPALYVGSHHMNTLIRFGRARQAFCHDLLSRAVSLVHKHQLLQKASVEAVQILVLLTPLLDVVDPTLAEQLSAASSRHVRVLGLQSSEEIDETDRKAVEMLFNQMQEKRVWCSAWTRDAISTCLYRRVPEYEEERAIRTGGAKVNGPSPPTPELTPQMGLSFSVMAMMQVGVLARFITKHVDSIAPPVLLSPQDRFPMLPTASDNHKLARAVHAVWKSNDALNAFFDRCTVKAWTQMEALKIFKPKAWIATVKVMSAMLNLSVYRILGERHRINAAYLQAVSQTHGAHVISHEDLMQSQALRELFETSSMRALISCRKVARFVGKVLAKPSLTFQTGGISLRQIFPVAQFLARSPVEDNVDVRQPHDPALDLSGAAWSQSHNAGWRSMDASGPAGTGLAGSAVVSIDPQALDVSLAGTFIPNVLPEAPPAPSELVSLAMDFDAPLTPFTAEQKSREINACLEALEQLGFAWPMEEEIESIRGILASDSSDSLAAPQWSMS
ncbi:unnamed protein product [Parajaminaea phylloscopi]